jgi:FlaA1/EpsC-like NDP-sugar epimerase
VGIHGALLENSTVFITGANGGLGTQFVYQAIDWAPAVADTTIVINNAGISLRRVSRWRRSRWPGVR